MATSSVFVALSALLTVLATGHPVDAQRPERQQDVHVPRLDVSLKPGWQLRIYDGCRFAVPRSWRAADDGSVVTAPDGSNLSMRRYRIRNWSDHTAQIKTAFGHVRTLHEDSARRLWFEIGDPPRVQHYIDVNNNGMSSCTGLLEIRAATTLSVEDTNRIADSIGPAPAQWPAGAIK